MTDEDILREHQALVEAFGGRINSPSKSLLSELGRTVLGSTKTLPTSGAVPISAAPITLCEMVVAHPIAVDVTFSYPNLINQEGPTPFGVPLGGGVPLDVGTGYVQITWGVKGATKMVVKVDGGTGWRFPFVASQLLVQYFPVDEFITGGGRVIPVNQPVDLQIAAMIAPASGAPCLPLERTVYFPEITAVPAISHQGQVPLFAKEWRVEAATNPATEYSVSFFIVTALQTLSLAPMNGVAGQFPNWQLPGLWYTVPQGAPIVNFGINVGQVIGIGNPAIKFRLGL